MNQPVPLHELVEQLAADRAHVRTERCACGGWITADRRLPSTIVAAHNRTIEHQTWWERVREEWQGRP